MSSACPSCGHTLTELTVAGITAWACAGSCGGLWFPIKFVRRLSGRPPGTGEEFLRVERAEGVRLFRNPEHPCPHCRTTLLYRHCFSKNLEMEIDQCSKCGGYWVDPGILARLGDTSRSDEANRKLARGYFAELFDRRVRGMNLVNHDTLESARQVMRIFLFITPADFLPQTLPLELE